ncbi:MAG TPA: TonB-dependent receptor [Polyangia bacterium]|nr:TonB-dependent receptor [Polyangia bacterium]
MLTARSAAGVLVFSLLCGGAARAADDPGEPAAGEPPSSFETIVTATTPVHGSGLPLDQVPANVRSGTGADLADHHSLDLSSYLSETMGSVHVNDVQGNPLQPDLQYRGFLASPLLGAPQGLSVFLDGVRLNEPFGDTVDWDLIPTNAIRSMEIIPGSNPVFGLNTLGGAISIETEDGFSAPGVDASLLYGSWNRKLVRASGGLHRDRFGLFAAVEIFDEDGWRQLSPASSQRAFVAGSYRDGDSKLDLTLQAANTDLAGNGVSPIELLAVDRSAIFTAPDTTANQLLMATLRGERALAPELRLSGTAFVRTNRTKTSNGDQHDWIACTANPNALCTTGDGGMEVPILNAAGAPVAFDDAYDAAENRTDTRQTSYGLAAQLAVSRPLAGRENHLFVGAEGDQSRVRFRSSTTVGELDANRDTVDDGFLDPTSPIAVDSVTNDLGVYASDTFSPLTDLHLVVSGRFNLTALSLQDQLGDDLTGDHSYDHFNPAAGVSYQPRRWLGGYFSFSESNRAPTAIELTCASPTDPCRLPNAFVSDPPLAQVVARTLEAGLRGTWRRAGLRLGYDLTAFQTVNDDDILFISSGMVANQGYFANVGRTRRQGIEADLTGSQRIGKGSRLEWGLHYTLTDARFESAFTALSATHPEAVNGLIDVPAGARIPSIPMHVGKLAVTYVAAFGLSAGVNVVADSGQFYRGDEANLLPQIPGYVVVDARAEYRVGKPLSVFALVDNIFGAQYSTFGVLGDATDVFPTYTDPRFLGPGAPRAAWGGVDVRY